MWSTISSLKDNISQIASDVLDTAQELEAGGNYRDADGNDGPPALSVFSPVREQADEEREAQLNWYKAEVRRLAESETEIQALSMNYVKLLKEKEEEVRSLWTLSEELKAKLATNDAERARKEAENCRAEIEQLKRQNAALTEELKRAREIQQEQIASLQERHQKRMESLLARHKRELASVHVQTVAQSSENEQGPHASKDSPAGDESTDGCADVAGLTEQVRQLKQQIEWAREREKELADQVVEKDNLYGRLKDTHETALAELQAMKVSLENEKAAVEDVGDQLERSQVMAEASARECNMLKGERQHIRAECEQARQELEKLQLETRSTMKATMVAHERQLANVQAERESLQKELDLANKEADRMRLQVKAKMLADSDDLLNGRIAKGLPPNAAELESQADEANRLAEMLNAAKEENSKLKEEMEAKMALLVPQRDKAVRDLARLKEHLLAKENADSEKMDEDRERIGQLEERAQAAEEKAASLSHSLMELQARLKENLSGSSEEILKLSSEVETLRLNLAECMKVIELKDTEVLNLQSALGAFYAERDAQERLHGELIAAREAISRLQEQLKMERDLVAGKEADRLASLSMVRAAESKLVENQKACAKLQGEVSKLRMALEHSMTRINRMSTDSDFYVDRRIVIKLLVTFFQRNHSKEVLDLMARMLGFSEEDKQRVGLSRRPLGRRGMLSGVLGVPGRLVGGFIGSGGTETTSATIPEDKDQSFSDLWIDFLLKESQGQMQAPQAAGHGIEKTPSKSAARAATTSPDDDFKRSHSKSYSELSPSIVNVGTVLDASSYPNSPTHNKVSMGIDLSPFSTPGRDAVQSRPPSRDGSRRGNISLDGEGANSQIGETPIVRNASTGQFTAPPVHLSSGDENPGSSIARSHSQSNLK